MKGDFSRHTFDRNRPYSSVRMQQGRVLVDADWNEQGDIQEHLRREALRDIIGKSGVPESQASSFEVFDDGGAIGVRPGRIWVDGMLCEENAITIDPTELPPAGSDGTWLVYLEARQRHLTAIEDPSIREVALGGPDTCTRTKTTCRVRLQEVDANSCEAVGDFVPEGNTDGSMAAGTVQPTDTSDPCVVPSQAGYAGLENQLYRIEIHRGGSTSGPGPRPTFKWSRHNGSVLSAWTGRSGRELSLESLGRDTERGFSGAQWVELGDDDLDAKEQVGPLVEVEAVTPSEHGEGGTLTIVAGDEPQLYDPDPQKHPKVRRWDSGAIQIDTTTWQDLELHLRVQFTPGTYRAGDYWWIPARAFVGEFSGSIEWPETGGIPDSIPPHGVARSIAKLGLVHLDAAGMQIDDCRCVFPTLCHHHHESDGGCCCTVTVGPDAEYRTIQEGIAALPDSGGQVCIEDGIYVENVVLDRGNITLRGCGPRTLWQAPDFSRPALEIVTRDKGLENIAVQDLTFETEGSVAIALGPKTKVRQLSLTHLDFRCRQRAAVIASRVFDLRVSDCRVIYQDAKAEAPSFRREPALYLGGRRLRIENNLVLAMDPPRAAVPGDPSVPGFKQISPAAGGVQITGRSEDVWIRGNQIVGGSWNGITLGSVRNFAEAGSVKMRDWRYLNGKLEGAGVDEIQAHYADFIDLPAEAPIATSPDGVFLDRWFTDGNNGSLISDGDLKNVRIIDNWVQGMGACALASAHFFELDGDLPDLIGVDGLVVENNLFEGNLRLHPWIDALQRYPDVPFGAVCLAGVGGRQHRAGAFDLREVSPRVDNRFENNVITGNAEDWLTEPVCGIWIQLGRGLTFRGNRVADNGGSAQADLPPEEGRRGGVVIGLATVDAYRVSSEELKGLGVRQDGIPALVFHDNVVVSRQGRALDVLAFGPTSITDNQLTAHGTVWVEGDLGTPGVEGLGLENLSNKPVGQRFGSPYRNYLDLLGGEAVRVINMGTSNELYLQSFGFSGLSRADLLLDPESRGQEIDAALINGNILFHDNQVVLDALGQGRTFAMSSILLLTLGHVSMQGNQADANMPLGELLMTEGLTFGFSQQMTDNRFTKGMLSGLLSAVTLGLMNTTVDNQGTHCFLGLGLPQISRIRPNQVMSELFIPEICGWIERLQAKMGFPRDPGGSVPGGTDGSSPGGSGNDSSIDKIREALDQEGPFFTRATDRIQLRGYDYVMDAWQPMEIRSGLNAAADSSPEAAELFLEEREFRKDLRVAGHDREQAVLGLEEKTVGIVGRVSASKENELPKNLTVVLSDRKGPDAALATADVDPEGLYRLSVGLDDFRGYFKGKKYLNVSAVYGKEPLVTEERAIGRPERPSRRVDLKI